jgi:hypothetical protein
MCLNIEQEERRTRYRGALLGLAAELAALPKGRLRNQHVAY